MSAIFTIWFEYELEPALEAFETKEDQKGASRQSLPPQEALDEARSRVEITIRDWESLGQAPASPPRTLWLVHLRCQFEAKSGRFISAQCGASLEPAQNSEPKPTVYDMYPLELTEGEPQTIALKFNPNFKIGPVEINGLDISTEITRGKVQPVIVGFPGKDDRAPHWNLQATKYPLEKTLSLWLILAQPAGCNEMRLRPQVRGTIQTSWGPIPVRPTQQIGKSSPSILIPSGVREE